MSDAPAFGLVGSILVDIYGVRRVSMVSLSVAMVGRTLIAFGRTKGALYLTLYFFSPCGDALLSIGLYKVALKKLTTPLTRPLGFALSYSIFNLAGAFSLVLIDLFRSSLKDVNIETKFVAGVYTPTRQFVVVTWMILLLTWIIAYCFLEDLTVIDTYDPEDDCIIQHQSMGDTQESLAPAEPMVRPRLLRCWFPNQYQSPRLEENETNNNQAAIGGAETVRNFHFPHYKMYKTQYANTRGGTSLRSGVITFFNQVIVILRMRATWRVMVFGLATSSIAMNWTASELILPAFLERRFGESTPIYIIQSINLFGCLILPPLVGAYTSGREDFSVFMPGLWVMAISPIFIAMSPNVIGACAWQVVMTVGEVFWSPRQGSWTASLAPTGSEGLFFAVSSARNVFGPLTDFIMGAINEKYNSNCPECRDQYGHFCQNLSSDENLQCASVQESCNLFLENNQQSCPGTCLQCPYWEPNDPSICWYLLLLVSIVSPLCVWFFLPFLRGNHSRNDKCYGLFSCNKNRFSGIYGALHDEDVDGCQSYGHVSDYEYKRKISVGDDVELT
ncbi:hypothetical protein ACHAW5_003526 [Stephanodiscus triporus]|uniref:Uncharacterized protein n=1 Tax=Stephanodiscus triporus TaxID=2934178 RepID=A0ABD3PEK7_9STRA